MRRIRIAAYQAPLAEPGTIDVIGLIRARVEQCDAAGVSILCCPEAVLGGLADDAEDPYRFAIAADRLEAALAPLASGTVTTIVGFTELGEGRDLYNSAAVFHRGSLAGIYRKQHPFIRRSIYRAGVESPVFRVGPLVFGIIICNDSNFDEPARTMAAAGAAALFVPSNNGLPPAKGGPGLVTEAHAVDIRLAVENRVWVIRADVAGRSGPLECHGTSAVVDPAGRVVRAAAPLVEDLLVAEIGPT